MSQVLLAQKQVFLARVGNQLTVILLFVQFLLIVWVLLAPQLKAPEPSQEIMGTNKESKLRLKVTELQNKLMNLKPKLQKLVNDRILTKFGREQNDKIKE
jgi:hypothetical protein